MASATSGMPSATLIQKRRVMSRSSGLSSSAAVTVIGSSAMPQIGHAPGPSRTISGCMGQVHLRLACRATAARVPGPCRTWGMRRDACCANLGIHRADVETGCGPAFAAVLCAAEAAAGLGVVSTAPDRRGTWLRIPGSRSNRSDGCTQRWRSCVGSTLMPQTGSRSSLRAAPLAGDAVPSFTRLDAPEGGLTGLCRYLPDQPAKLFAAAARAEVVEVLVVFGDGSGGARRIDSHAADRIFLYSADVADVHEASAVTACRPGGNRWKDISRAPATNLCMHPGEQK